MTLLHSTPIVIRIAMMLAAVAMLPLLLGACAPASAEIKPPEIAYGRDVCSSCGMIISEPRFASASLLTDGKTMRFDDLGEMFFYHRERHPDLQVRAWFVHDYHSFEWLRAEEAYYVTTPDLQTPMGFGTAAFRDPSAAEEFSKRYGVPVKRLDGLDTKPLKSMGRHGGS